MNFRPGTGTDIRLDILQKTAPSFLFSSVEQFPVPGFIRPDPADNAVSFQGRKGTGDGCPGKTGLDGKVPDGVPEISP